MKALLDTNILIHREAARVIRKEIGVLFRWLDGLRYEKCVHPVSVTEIDLYGDERVRESFRVKLESYTLLQVQAPLHPSVAAVGAAHDVTVNDRNDTLLLNELYCGRVNILLTEDKKIHLKAASLGVSGKVFRIESFLEKVTAENPGFSSYKVLAVKKELFGNVDVKDEFFDGLKQDYPQFEDWFNGKSEEPAYICTSGNRIAAFLYLKVEGDDEPHFGIEPQFPPRKRLKIGTFKVALNGYRLGERFLKIVFDNAIRNRVEEVYVTTVAKTPEQLRLVALLEDFGFVHHGKKTSQAGTEEVYVRSMAKRFDQNNPRLTYPYFSRTSRCFLAPIYPAYHTNLFPDSILNNESPLDFVENEPFRNAISKVYICRSHFRELQSGDLVVFYRTGGYHRAVVTTIGVVENVVNDIPNAQTFISECRKRSVFSDAELMQHWNYIPSNHPFVVNFLYHYSFPRRPNLAKLIDLGVIRDVSSAPRGFTPITTEQLTAILRESGTDASIVVG